MSEPDRSSEPRDTAPDQTDLSKRLSQQEGQDTSQSLRPVVKNVMEEMVEELHMAMRSGPPPNPILEKVTSEHIDKLLAAEERDNERDHERFKIRATERKDQVRLRFERQTHAFDVRSKGRTQRLIALSIMGGFVLVVVFALCWLFLAFQQAQYIVTVISSLFAFVGGLGIGRWTTKSQEPPPKPEEPGKPDE